MPDAQRTNSGPPLVDRLRARDNDLMEVRELCWEAADEIERLRTALNEIWGTLSPPPSDLSYDYQPDWKWCLDVAARATGRTT